MGSLWSSEEIIFDSEDYKGAWSPHYWKRKFLYKFLIQIFLLHLLREVLEIDRLIMPVLTCFWGCAFFNMSLKLLIKSHTLWARVIISDTQYLFRCLYKFKLYPLQLEWVCRTRRASRPCCLIYSGQSPHTYWCQWRCWWRLALHKWRFQTFLT